jgi:formate dehydrogenase
MNSWLSETIVGGYKDLSGDRVEIHPSLGARLGIDDGEQVRVTSTTSALLATALYSPDVRADVAVMEQGWGSRVFDPISGQASVQGVNRNLLVANSDLDPLSAVPRLNGTPIRIEKYLS